MMVTKSAVHIQPHVWLAAAILGLTGQLAWTVVVEKIPADTLRRVNAELQEVFIAAART